MTRDTRHRSQVLVIRRDDNSQATSGRGSLEKKVFIVAATGPIVPRSHPSDLSYRQTKRNIELISAPPHLQ